MPLRCIGMQPTAPVDRKCHALPLIHNPSVVGSGTTRPTSAPWSEPVAIRVVAAGSLLSGGVASGGGS
ncbi:MAG: hypothetical protein QG608_1901 [Actinomycetota bacterium]|nr:hypothetical protein [Actinomycetota bacterium]